MTKILLVVRQSAELCIHLRPTFPAMQAKSPQLYCNKFNYLPNPEKQHNTLLKKTREMITQYVRNGTCVYSKFKQKKQYCTVQYCTVLYRYCTVQYSTVLYCTVLFCTSTVLYSTVLYCTVQYCSVPVLYCTVQYCTVLYRYCTVQYSTIQYCTVSRCKTAIH